jgi:hypothetical protein
MLESPASLTTPAGLSVNYNENIKTLQSKIKEIADVVPSDGSGSGASVLYRQDYR